MQNKIVEWLVTMLLSKLDSTVAAKALIGLMRGAMLALKDVAARTSSTLDDTIVARASDIVEELAKLLKVT